MAGPQQLFSAQGPTDEQFWHLGSPTAETIEQRLEAVDAVIRARVVSGPTTGTVDLRPGLERQNPGATLPHPVLVPVTEYELQVTEVIRGHVSVVGGAALRIGRIGGRVALSDRVLVSNTRMPALAEGAEYLILLEYNKTFDMLMFAVEDLFRLDGGRVRTEALSTRPPYAQQLAGKNRSRVLARVRAAVAAANLN